MRVHICGSRGSTPAPGPAFDRYGGHTSCVAVARDGEPPTLVLDAGTGLRRLTGLLEGRAFRGAILLGHLHWDHTQGLPFFQAGDRPDADVDLYVPEQGDTVEVLTRAMGPPHFPITPTELRGAWRFHGLPPGHHRIGAFEVLALDIPHKGGRTFGYRVGDGTASLAYLSDHSPTSVGDGPDGFGMIHEAALELARDVDLLVHDAQYTAAEFEARRHFGHSAIDYAVHLAEAAGARQLLLFHHDPPRTDDALDEIVGSLEGAAVPVRAAADGMVLDL